MQRRLGFMVVCMMAIALSVYGTGAKEQQPVTLKVLMVSGCVASSMQSIPYSKRKIPMSKSK